MPPAHPVDMKLSFHRVQVPAFRLARHHFLDRKPAALPAICRDVGGLQAQVTAAAELALWARNHGLTRAGIQSALWERRALVKTSLMRQTLHWVPASEFSLYIAALKRSRGAALRRIMARYAGVTPKDIDALTAAVVEALGDGPLTRRELAERIEPRVPKTVRKWMAIASSVMTVRPALVEGLVCYGPDRGAEVTYVRVDHWLPKQKAVEEKAAKQFLLRRYLGAYGPATLQDFSKWAGIPAGEAKAIWESLGKELVEVSIEGQRAALLGKDRKALADSDAGRPVLRLLPSFDPFLLGHADKSALVSPRFYKRVYRNQGWISPVVLLNGRVIGTWSHARRSKSLLLEVKLFEKPSKTICARIGEEAASLGRFLETSWQVKYSR